MTDEQIKEIKEQIRKGIQKVENIREKYDELREKYKNKEQECETLASQLDFEVQKKECLEQECEKLKERFEIAKETSNRNLKALGEMTELAVKLDEENDQLKAENDELKKLLKVRIEDLCDSCGASSMIPMPCKVYEKTLTEIKEIAEKMKKMSEEDGGELTECFFIDKQCEKCSEDKCLPYWFEQILQKISEVEDD